MKCLFLLRTPISQGTIYTELLKRVRHTMKNNGGLGSRALINHPLCNSTVTLIFYSHYNGISIFFEFKQFSLVLDYS